MPRAGAPCDAGRPAEGVAAIEAKQIAEAARLLAAARRDRTRIRLLPEACRPRSVAEAHAIQDAVTATLAVPVAAFKANLPNAASAPSGAKDASAGPWSVAEGVRAPIYAPTVQASPGRFAVAEVPQCGVEGEVAFRFRRDLPRRETPYSRDEIAASVDALAAIEVVTSRYADPDAAGFLDKLADNVSNGGFVPGTTVAAWQGLDLGKLAVTLTVNGAPVLSQIGGHPTGDPLGIAVALVEMLREVGGVRDGQYVTCGSCTGLRYLKPGDYCRVDFAGLGTAEVTFVP